MKLRSRHTEPLVKRMPSTSFHSWYSCRLTGLALLSLLWLNLSVKARGSSDLCHVFVVASRFCLIISTSVSAGRGAQECQAARPQVSSEVSRCGVPYRLQNAKSGHSLAIARKHPPYPYRVLVDANSQDAS